MKGMMMRSISWTITRTATWTITLTAGLATLALLTGCLSTPGALPACDGWSETAICGLMNPEDLAPLDAQGWVLVSEMTHSTTGDPEKPFQSGRLTAIRLGAIGADVERQVLFPVERAEWAEFESSESAAPAERKWGETSCPGPPTRENFQPHGIDVAEVADGTIRVGVVTHGDREVIDFFELGYSDPDKPGSASGEPMPELTWRGCVSMRPGRNANDLALLEDGGFVVTDMLPAITGIGPSAIWTMLKINFGGNTGSVLRWSPEQEGFIQISSSEGSAPNGVAATPDGRSIYVAEWGAGRVVRLRFEKPGPRVRREVPIKGSPDNLTWTPEGRLLVGAQEASAITALGCGAIESVGCDIGYTVTEIDPETLGAEIVAEGRGAVSVALDVGEDRLIGVFAGDTLERQPKPD